MSDGFLDPLRPIKITRGGGLPHWHQDGTTAFVTFRAGDSVPAPLLARGVALKRRWLARRGIDSGADGWRERLTGLPERDRREYRERFSRAFLAMLDRGHGACLLADPATAAIVAAALRHFDGDHYDLSDAVVMPNHVHALVTPRPGHTLASICESWKRFTARRINAMHGRRGHYWQSESFDRLVRNPLDLARHRRYIAENPKKLRPGTYLLLLQASA